MEPGQVWLNLIPFFNMVWMFITVIRLSESLDREYRDRRLPGDGDFAKQTGIIYLVLSIIGCGCIGIIFYIMYWSKISGYGKELRADGGSRGRDRGDDRGDDRPSRRRREEDDRPRRDDRDYDDGPSDRR